MYGNDEELEKDPIMHLFHVYVETNKAAEAGDILDNSDFNKFARTFFKLPRRNSDSLVSLLSLFSFGRYCTDPTIHDRAREYFKKMEDGDEEAIGLWSKFRFVSRG